ncbi:MAG TPA: FAD-dependent oxidoreductase, partial [Chitinophagaceae bacterium]|nr:FAD-dependent oxidoreductase [Chitinophagaceae bacterium]
NMPAMNQTSVWEKETFFAHKDIIIAGSGLVGLWSAYYLKKAAPAARILILERGIIPTGASTRNAGFACIGSATELLADARKIGEQGMLDIVAMRYEGLQRIKKTFSNKEIDFERNGGYELIAGTQYTRPKQLKNDLGWLNIILRKAIKDQKTFRIADKKIKDFGFKKTTHLVESRMEAQLHSGKLLQALLRKVQSMGVLVITQAEVKGYEKVNGRLLIQTNLAQAFTCSQLLVCTNGFAKTLLPTVDVQPVRGQVLVTSPIKKLRFKGAFHFDEGYYYFRNLSNNRVLLGGARNSSFSTENTAEMQTTDVIQGELERFLREVVLPKQAFTIEHRWSGIMGMGSDKMPIIKRIEKNVYCAVRMSGMGVALSPVVGDIVARQMLQ